MSKQFKVKIGPSLSKKGQVMYWIAPNWPNFDFKLLGHGDMYKLLKLKTEFQNELEFFLLWQLIM